MSIIKWSNSLMTGNKQIDDEHKFFVSIINKLHTYIINSQSKKQIHLVVSELYDYANYHFAHEEELMATIGYPRLEAHKVEHAVFCLELDVLNRNENYDEIYLLEDLFKFTTDWLLEHIKYSDRDIARFLHENAINI